MRAVLVRHWQQARVVYRVNSAYAPSRWKLVKLHLRAAWLELQLLELRRKEGRS